MKVDSSRQLDAFAELNLGASDDDADEGAEDEPQVLREGLVKYVSLAGPSDQPATPAADTHKTEESSQSKKKRSKNKRKRTKAKATKWADKCMYAELLEMKEEMSLWDKQAHDASDGLPSDLEGGWVAVAPVPTGKRCLAVTHQSAAGVIGICKFHRALFRDNPEDHFHSAQHHPSIPSPWKDAPSSISVFSPSPYNSRLYS